MSGNSVGGTKDARQDRMQWNTLGEVRPQHQRPTLSLVAEELLDETCAPRRASRRVNSSRTPAARTSAP
jgi:hypothetical protein